MYSQPKLFYSRLTRNNIKYSVFKGLLLFCLADTRVNPDLFCFCEILDHIQDIAVSTLEPHAMYEKNTLRVYNGGLFICMFKLINDINISGTWRNTPKYVKLMNKFTDSIVDQRLLCIIYKVCHDLACKCSFLNSCSHKSALTIENSNWGRQVF